MNRRRKPRRFPYSLVLAVLLLAALPLATDRETVIRPVWWIDLAAWQPGITDRPTELRPFRFGRRLGYYDPDGRVPNMEEVLYGAAIGQERYINYSQVPSNLVIKGPLGGFWSSLGTRRYPLMDQTGHRIFLINLESTGIAEVADDGRELWRAEFASIITTVAIGDADLLVGLADGSLRLFGADGSPIYGVTPEGSRVSIILGCDIAESGALAAICGLDPQRLVIIERRDGNYVETASYPLVTDHRREVIVRFARGGGRLFFEDGSGLGVLDLERGRLEGVSLDGRIRAMAESPDGLLAVAHGDGLILRVVVLSPDGELVYQETIEAGSVFLDWTDRGLVVGYDDRLIGLEVGQL